jgi:hypothetical protein
MDKKPSGFSIGKIFRPDYEFYDGVPRINIYLLRLMFLLMIFFLGRDSWTHVLTHKGAWDPADAMSWCVWAAYSVLAILAFFQPVKMLPIVMLEIFYKVLWLIVVAYPLWSTHTLEGSPAEGMTNGFIWVILPIVAMPWPYVIRRYILMSKK